MKGYFNLFVAGIG